MSKEKDLGESLEEWYQGLVKTMQLSIDEQVRVTNAGAQVFKQELKKVTPVSDRDSQHAKDSIIAQAKDIDGMVNGSSTVGYDEEHGYIMRFMNDGTKKYPKRKDGKAGKNHLGFYNKVLTNRCVQDKVVQAEATALSRLLKGENK